MKPLRSWNVQTVAVCFVNAYANPAHELRMREILEEELPGVQVSTSAEVLPERYRSMERGALLARIGELRALLNS